jgi:hypothetical protein
MFIFIDFGHPEKSGQAMEFAYKHFSLVSTNCYGSFHIQKFETERYDLLLQ